MQFQTGRWSRQLTGMGMRPPLYLSLLTLVVYLFWREYDFAVSDQDEVLPYLMNLLDPRLFSLDWFVNAQLDTFGPRTLFVLVLWVPAKLFGVYATTLAFYVISWFGTSMALYMLGLQLTRERLTATICVIIAMLLTPKFTLGGNDLVTWILTPSIPAWTLSLWGLVFFVRGRAVQGAVLMGVATWIQALVGLQVAMVCTLLLFWKHGFPNRSPYQFMGYFALASLPALGPLIWFQLVNPSPEGIWSYFYILFEFRAPHHYLPSSFDPQSGMRFAALLSLGLISFPFLRGTHRVLIRRSLLIIGSLCALSLLCTEIFQITFIAKLQLFKLTVVVKVLSIILFSNAVAQLVLRFHRRTVTIFFDHGHYALGATMLLAATLLIISPDALGIRPASTIPPSEQVAKWAQSATEVDAVFAVPPQWAHFRSQAQRAIVVNFKAVPFHEPFMSQWITRLLDIAPVDLPSRGGAPMMSTLDSAFFALSTEEIHRLAGKYRFDYIVWPNTSVLSGFESVFEADPWRVWRIESQP